MINDHKENNELSCSSVWSLPFVTTFRFSFTNIFPSYPADEYGFHAFLASFLSCSHYIPEGHCLSSFRCLVCRKHSVGAHSQWSAEEDVATAHKPPLIIHPRAVIDCSEKWHSCLWADPLFKMPICHRRNKLFSCLLTAICSIVCLRVCYCVATCEFVYVRCQINWLQFSPPLTYAAHGNVLHFLGKKRPYNNLPNRLKDKNM